MPGGVATHQCDKSTVPPFRGTWHLHTHARTHARARARLREGFFRTLPGGGQHNNALITIWTDVCGKGYFLRGSLAGWGQRTNALTTMGTDVSGNNPKDPLTQRQPNPVRGIPSPCKKALFLKVIGKPPLTHVYKHELALSNLATPQRFLEGAVRL